MLQVRTAKQSVGYNGIPDRVISRVAPAFAQPQNYTGSGNRRRCVVSTLVTVGSRGHRLSNGAAREGSVTVRFASDANKRVRNMSELPPISNRDTSSRSWRSSKSSGASALPRGAVVAYEKPMLLSVDGQLAEESSFGVGGAVKRTFSSPGQNTASSGNSRRSISCKSQGVGSTGTGNNNNVRAPATQRLATQCDKSTNFARQKPQTIGYYDTGGVTSNHQSGLKRAKSFGNLPRQPSVPGGNSKARSAKLATAGSKQFAYTNSSAATSRRLAARHADKQLDAIDAPSQNGVEPPPTEVTSDSDFDVGKQDMILQWLIGVDDLAERPLSPDCIHHCGPEQSDTAIHIVYDGDWMWY